MKPTALLLLLAVAVSQVDQVYSVLSESLNISDCPITFFGRSFNNLDFTNVPGFRFCFTDSPTSGSAEDCIAMQQTTGIAKVILEPTAQWNISEQIAFKNNYTQFQSTHKCSNTIRVLDARNDTLFMMYLVNFEQQAAFGFQVANFTPVTYNFNLFAGAKTMRPWVWTKSDASPEPIYKDISGCRTSGGLFLPNTTLFNTGNCTTLICDAHARLRNQSNSTCVSERQNQNQTQIRNQTQTLMCSVVGSNVIDFYNRVYSIPDRCVYTLMEIQRSSDFNVFAGFRERRLKDHPFLNHVVISTSGRDIVLEQGGRVWVDGQKVLLNSSIQMIYGVELSRDHMGVTARARNMTVVFDGNSAHIIESGPLPPLEGLCGDNMNPHKNTTVTASKALLSRPSCEIRYPDPVNVTKNCNDTAKRASLLKEEPFTICHDAIDPELFVTAATDTLCGYPPVDNMFCHFLESYAKACYLKANITVKGWRAKAKCPEPKELSCQNTYCSRHEFCGDDYDQPRCFCRALFAAKYRPTNSLGDPTVCTHNTGFISLAQCLLEEHSIDYTTLHLKDKNCVGELDKGTHMVNFHFNSDDFCGTEVVTNSTEILYKNAILSNKNNITGIISRQDQVSIAFSCLYTKPDIQSVSFRIVDSSVVQRIVSGTWNYTMTMNAFTDSGLRHKIMPNTEMQLNQKVFVLLEAKELDDAMVSIVTEACWVTNTPSPNSSLRYDLVIGGCPNPADDTVTVEGNGEETANLFSFNMFQFAGENSNLFLHCRVELCAIKGPSCKPNCRSGLLRRRRRSMDPKHGEANPTIITMAWN